MADAEEVQRVYDSQPRIMLRCKEPGDPEYAGVFRSHLLSGCISYGAFSGEELRAFCTVWQWPGLPIGTLVIFASQPDGRIFNPERTGLAAAVSAALAHLDRIGVPTVYLIRAKSKKWTNSGITKRFAAFRDAFAKDVERIPAGSLSKHEGINAYVMGGTAPKADAVLICVMQKPLGDF